MNAVRIDNDFPGVVAIRHEDPSSRSAPVVTAEGGGRIGSFG